MDLADIAKRLQEKGEVWAAARHPHAIAALRKRAHHMASDKARAAENGDQLVRG
jgi:hypothetical protein